MIWVVVALRPSTLDTLSVIEYSTLASSDPAGMLTVALFWASARMEVRLPQLTAAPRLPSGSSVMAVHDQDSSSGSSVLSGSAPAVCARKVAGWATFWARRRPRMVADRGLATAVRLTEAETAVVEGPCVGENKGYVCALWYKWYQPDARLWTRR